MPSWAPCSSTWNRRRPAFCTLCPSLAAILRVTSVRFQPASSGAGTAVRADAGGVRSVAGRFWSDWARSRIRSQ